MSHINYNDPYSRIPTLADEKSRIIQEKLSEKKTRLDPNPDITVQDNNSDISSLAFNNEPGYGNIVKSSFLNAGGVLADASRNISNSVFNTNYDASRETGLSNKDIANAEAGVTPELTLQGEKLYENVAEKSADVLSDPSLGNIASLVKSGFDAGPYFAADSAASAAEYLGGVISTAALGTGAPILANKVYKTVKGAEKFAERIERIKKVKDNAKALKEASKAGKAFKALKNLPKASAKAASQASIISADLTQRGVQDYVDNRVEEFIKENNRQPSPEEMKNMQPSKERVAAIALGKMVTTIVEPAIISKLFIGSFKNQIIREGSSLMKYAKGTSAVKNIIERVALTTKDIIKAGAAEAGQEYVQTWEEIMSSGMTPEEASNLKESLVKYLSDPEKQKIALAGGTIGLGAGGVTKGAMSVPTLAAGTTVDSVVGTAKTTVKTAAKAAKVAGSAANAVRNRIDIGLISESEREVLKNDYEVSKKNIDTKLSDIEEKIGSIKNSNLSDIKPDSEIDSIVKQTMKDLDMTEDDISKKRNEKKVKDKIIRTLKAQQAKIELEFYGSNKVKAAKVIGKGIKNKSVELAKAAVDAVPQEVVEATIKAKIKSEEAVKLAVEKTKEIKSSSAYGIIEMSINGSSKQIKTALTAAKDLSISDIERVATVVEQYNPNLAKQFERISEAKNEALGRLGQRNNDIVDESNFDKVLLDVINKNNINKVDGPPIAQKITKMMSSVISDQYSLDNAKKVLDLYKNSEAYTGKKEDGSLTSHTIDVFERRLENAQKRIDRNAETIVDKVVEKGTSWIRKAGNLITDSVFDMEAKARLSKAKDISEEEVQKVQKEIDEAKKQLIEERQKELEEKSNEKSTGKKIVETISDIKEGTVEFISSVKEGLRDKKVMKESDSGIYPQLKNTSDALESDKVTKDTVKQILSVVPIIVKQLNKAGYVNKNDLKDLTDQFPGLKSNSDIYELIESMYDTENVSDEYNDQNLRDTPIKEIASTAIEKIKNRILRCK